MTFLAISNGTLAVIIVVILADIFLVAFLISPIAIPIVLRATGS